MEEEVASVESLTAYIESRFPVSDFMSARRAPTGERYVELTLFSPYAREEGNPAPYCPSQSEAVAAAKRAFDRYASDRSGILYWCIKPEVEYSPTRKGWAFYMRMLISNKERQ